MAKSRSPLQEEAIPSVHAASPAAVATPMGHSGPSHVGWLGSAGSCPRCQTWPGSCHRCQTWRHRRGLYLAVPCWSSAAHHALHLILRILSFCVSPPDINHCIGVAVQDISGGVERDGQSARTRTQHGRYGFQITWGMGTISVPVLLIAGMFPQAVAALEVEVIHLSRGLVTARRPALRKRRLQALTADPQQVCIFLWVHAQQLGILKYVWEWMDE